MITSDQLLQFAPHCKNADDVVSAVNAVMEKYQIDANIRRVRYFMTHCYVETDAFCRYDENLNYTTPERLVEVWPTHFTLDQSDTTKAFAPDYAGNSVKLANLIYANKYGNGDEASGDGYNFRGRGGFNNTFKENYSAFSQFMYNDDRLLSTPDLLATDMNICFESAGWFWHMHNFSTLADSDSFTRTTEILNGSSDTVQMRLQVLDRANTIFN